MTKRVMQRKTAKNHGWIEWCEDGVDDMEPKQRDRLFSARYKEAMLKLEILLDHGNSHASLAAEMFTGGWVFTRLREKPDSTSRQQWALVNFLLARAVAGLYDIGLRQQYASDTPIEELNYLSLSEDLDLLELNETNDVAIRQKFASLRVAEYRLATTIIDSLYTRTAQNYLRCLLSFVDHARIGQALDADNRGHLRAMVERVQGIAEKSEVCAQKCDQTVSKPMVLITAGCIGIFADLVLGCDCFTRPGVRSWIARGVVLPMRTPDGQNPRPVYMRNVLNAIEHLITSERTDDADLLLSLLDEATGVDSDLTADFAKAKKARSYPMTHAQMLNGFAAFATRLVTYAPVRVTSLVALLASIVPLCGDGVKTLL